MKNTRDARVYITLAKWFSLSDADRRRLDEVLDEPKIEKGEGWVYRYSNWCRKVHDIFSYVIKDDENAWNEAVVNATRMDKQRFPSYN